MTSLQIQDIRNKARTRGGERSGLSGDILRYCGAQLNKTKLLLSICLGFSS